MGNTKNTAGKRIYDNVYSFPQDSQDLADDIYDFSNARAGTSTARQSLPAAQRKPGMLWIETDAGEIYKVVGSNWESMELESTPWMNLTLSTGWDPISGHTPRARLLHGVVYVEGAVERKTGGLLTSIASIPLVLRHLQTGTKTVFLGAAVASRSGAYAMSELYVNNVGVLQVSGYSSIDSNLNWILPLGSSYVKDQR